MKVSSIIKENIIDTKLDSKEKEPLTAHLVDMKYKLGSGEHQRFLGS